VPSFCEYPLRRLGRYAALQKALSDSYGVSRLVLRHEGFEVIPTSSQCMEYIPGDAMRVIKRQSLRPRIAHEDSPAVLSDVCQLEYAHCFPSLSVYHRGFLKPLPSLFSWPPANYREQQRTLSDVKLLARVAIDVGRASA
jgi:hypothetical protein